MNYQDLLKKTKSHINAFYMDHADANLFYHNQSHAMDILEKTKKIAAHYYLDERTTFITCAAACFSNSSHLIKNGNPQKTESAKLTRAFFNSTVLNEEDKVAIEKCILATEMPQNPKSLAEKILCDADLYYLGTTGFMEENALLKKETEAVGNTKIDDNTWMSATIKLLENHRYHTGYGQLLLDNGKAANLERLRNLQKKAKNVKAAIAMPDAVGEELVTEAELDNLAPDEPKKKNRPGRGVETMFRIVASKNIKISEMADGKANIMISINSIIISVILGLMAGTLRENQNLIIPTVILLAVNVGTIIFSVLATRPKIPNGRFTPEDVSNRSVNLLYFGSFYKMNFKEYNEGLKEMMDDSDFLYGTLSKDTYWQGKVLGRKFRLLRISYTIFLYGIVASVLAFMTAIIFL